MRQVARYNTEKLLLDIGAVMMEKDNLHHNLALERCKRASIKLGFTWEQVVSKRRHDKLVDVRTCLCKFLRERDWTLTSIGETLNIHHATVLHHNKKFDDLFPIDNNIQKVWYIIKTS
jgi:chromosomal replication initiation ATPase DnaA